MQDEIYIVIFIYLSPALSPALSLGRSISRSISRNVNPLFSEGMQEDEVNHQFMADHIIALGRRF